MDAASPATAAGASPPPSRRADAGTVRLGGRDVAGLVLCGDMYGAPYDLLAAALDVQPAGCAGSWPAGGTPGTPRPAGSARPGWCWLTRPGLAVTGQRYAPARPALARLAHIRAVLAVRLSLEASDAYQAGQAWWRSERRIRAAAGGRVGTGHVPDAEVSWPDLPASTYAGECWAIEAELTPKPLARTAAIMRGLLSRTADYQPGARPGDGPRYDRVVYLASPAARSITERAAADTPRPAARPGSDPRPAAGCGAVMLVVPARPVPAVAAAQDRAGHQMGRRWPPCWWPPRRSPWWPPWGSAGRGCAGWPAGPAAPRSGLVPAHDGRVPGRAGVTRPHLDARSRSPPSATGAPPGTWPPPGR